LISEIKDATALIVRFAKITKKIIDSGENLKVISKTGTGVDNIDISAATNKGVFVCNVPALNADAVVEHTFSFMLALIKNLIETNESLISKGWGIRDKIWPSNSELYGRSLGIIGLGLIGSKVSKIAKAFGMKVFAYDPYVSNDKARELGVNLVELSSLLKTSDIVTIHCALTENTRNLINKNNIKLMKNTSFLINCARGQIVNEDALIEALKEERIAGAALDVFQLEPLEPNNPLLSMKNVIVTPHIAGLTYNVRLKTMEILVDDILKTLNGEKPINLVNPEVLEQIK
jgi:D-3-phosphoglycerate dehydrogenase